jgi:Domain of unknown function (DUF4815)
MTTDPRLSLPNYINTFDRSKGYESLAFLASRFLTSNEVNVIQDIIADRIKQVGDTMWHDGALVSGGTIALGAIDTTNKVVTATLDAAKVYINGIIHDIPAASLTISAVGTVVIGIWMRTFTVDYTQDPTLKGQAPGTVAQGEPGASALAMKGVWGYDSQKQDGDFYPIYTIQDGQISTPAPPGLDNTWLTLLAQYDRDAHGGYVVQGFNVTALGFDGLAQVFSVSEGTINVYGYKNTRPASFRLRVPETPVLQLINDEPHAVNSGTQTVILNFSPIASVDEVTIEAAKTVTLTHGAFTGVSDALPDPTVLKITAVQQGTTTYVQGTDYKLTGASVDWSLSGAEPAPGSTYTVSYHLITTANPTNIQRDRFDFTGAADGTNVFVKYQVKLPRIDAIIVDQQGNISYVTGISSLYAPQPVQVAPTVHKLADITNNWGLTPTVSQASTLRMPFTDLRDLAAEVSNLYALVADLRLQLDLTQKEPSSMLGVFTDPLLDDDERDQGIAQTGAIFGGYLWLPITPNVTTLPMTTTTLTFTPFNIFEQNQITGSSKINPYMNFNPPPTDCTLNPSMDLWTDVQDVWTSVYTSRTGWNSFGTHNQGSLQAITSQETDTVTGSNTTAEEYIRQRSVGFTVNKWGLNEGLKSLTFDGVDVTPPNLRADGTGTLTGSFNIPANVPCGVKAVIFTGTGGSVANALYTAYGWMDTISNERTVITTYWYESDPLAQTFRLTEPRQAVGVDLKFTAIGDRTKPVRVQIREVDSGIPTQRVVAEALIDMTNVKAIDPLSLAPRQESDWTTATFARPTTLRETMSYAITLLTDDATHSVAIADLGGFDQINGWVTSNAFPGGTFLDGSDDITWLPKPGRSLGFRLKVADYSPTTITIPVGTVTVANCSDLMPLIVSERPENTAIEVQFVAPDGTTYVTAPAANIQLSTAITGDIQVSLLLTGTDKLSPQMLPDLQVVAGSIAATGDYVSRAWPDGSDTKIRFIVDVYLPSTATFQAFIETAEPNGVPTWTVPTLDTSTPIGDGWETREYSVDHITATNTRVRCVLGGGPGARPNVQNIRGVAVPSTTGD